jgi:hypothetical protein
LGEVAIVTAKGMTERPVYVRLKDAEWRLHESVPIRAQDTVLHAAFIHIEGLDVVRVLSSNQDVHDLRIVDGKWQEHSRSVRLKAEPDGTDLAKVSTFGTSPLGLKHRGRIVLTPDSSEGLWRSLDGAQSWTHDHKGRRFEQLGQYHDGSVMICARVVMLDSNLKGIECSQDDGLTWQRLFSTVKPVSLSQSQGELAVTYEGLTLRLGRLIDKGQIRSELLFLGKTGRLSQTGQWFGRQLEQRVNAAKDRLLVSRPLQSISKGDDDTSGEGLNRVLPMLSASSDVLELPTTTSHTNTTWGYVIIGSITHSPRRQ